MKALFTGVAIHCAHNYLGVLSDKKGLYDAGIAEFKTALQIEIDNTMARKNLDIARKNKSTSEKRESQVLRAEKEAQAKPKDRTRRIMWLAYMLTR